MASARIIDVWALWAATGRTEQQVGLTQHEISGDLPEGVGGEILVDHLRQLHEAYSELHVEELEIRIRIH